MWVAVPSEVTCFMSSLTHVFMASCLCLTEEQYKVETRTIAVDFGKTDIYPKIEAGLAGLEIGVLGKRTVKRCWFLF